MTFEAVPAAKSFFEWSGSLSFAAWISRTPNVFPLIETVHLLALTVLLGTILMQDLRLLGVAVTGWAPQQISRQMSRLTPWALVIIAITGFFLLSSEADNAYHNPAFFWKMMFLAVAILQHYGFHVRALRLGTTQIPIWAKVSALVSLALWFGVGIMGRAIGFVVGTGPS